MSDSEFYAELISAKEAALIVSAESGLSVSAASRRVKQSLETHPHGLGGPKGRFVHLRSEAVRFGRWIKTSG